MAVPLIHAESSVKRYGGIVEDYLEIHKFMDSSKACVSDNRHRFLTHNSWFVVNVLPRVFGEMITNSDGKRVPVKDIGEYHILEDFRMKFIPTPQDYAEHLEITDWMNNGSGVPNRLKNNKSKVSRNRNIVFD